MTALLTTDPEGDVRTALRADQAVVAIAGSRSFFGADDLRESSYPCVIVQRVGGGDDPTNEATQNPILQVDVYGQLRKKTEATNLVNAVRQVLRGLGLAIESVVWAPNPDDKRPRYVLTAVASARAS